MKNQISRRAATGLSLFIFTILGTACAPRQATVGLLLYNESDPYILEFARQIMDEAGSSMTITRLDAGNSQLIQNEQIGRLLDGKPELLMINPVDRLGAYAIIRRLQTENVPVIFFNREPLVNDLAIWDQTYYVGAKAEQSGQMQARLVMELFGGDPDALNLYDRNKDGIIQIIVLKGEQGHQDAEIRTREVLRSFESMGLIVEVLALEVANWNRDEAYEKMGRLLRNFPDQVELVVSNNDAMALGAISRMRQEGMFKDTNGNGRVDREDESWVPVVGIDGLREAEESIRDGYLYGTVKNDSLSMAKAMTELAEALVTDRDLESLSFTMVGDKYIWIDYQPFVSQN
jgi:methyl-galactoside transport system substrate-binding protein